MPICSYLVIPAVGATERVRADLARIPECDVVAAENREVLILVTDTEGLREEEELRSSIESMEGIEALLFTFGEIDPDVDIPDPMSVRRRERKKNQEAPGRLGGPS